MDTRTSAILISRIKSLSRWQNCTRSATPRWSTSRWTSAKCSTKIRRLMPWSTREPSTPFCVETALVPTQHRCCRRFIACSNQTVSTSVSHMAFSSSACTTSRVVTSIGPFHIIWSPSQPFQHLQSWAPSRATTATSTGSTLWGSRHLQPSEQLQQQQRQYRDGAAPPATKQTNVESSRRTASNLKNLLICALSLTPSSRRSSARIYVC